MANTSRQRRMWVLPAPTGTVDKSDRYAIGIFYSFRFPTHIITKPLSILFRSSKKLQVFKSLWEKSVFVSERKQHKTNY